MRWWKVPAVAFVQADDYKEAIGLIMDRLYGADRAPQFMAQAGPAEERTDEQMAPMIALYARLDEATADFSAGTGVTMKEFPGARFSLAAAAQLAAADFEAGRADD